VWARAGARVGDTRARGKQVHIGQQLPWVLVGSLCTSVCKRWLRALSSDLVWQRFYAEHFATVAPRCRGYNTHRERLVPESGGQAKMVEFRDRHRRRIDRVFAELQTGWDWVRERLAAPTLPPDASLRCRQVIKKLARKEWTAVYESVALVILEHMEGVSHSVWKSSCASALRPPQHPPTSSHAVGGGGGGGDGGGSGGGGGGGGAGEGSGGGHASALGGYCQDACSSPAQGYAGVRGVGGGGGGGVGDGVEEERELGLEAEVEMLKKVLRAWTVAKAWLRGINGAMDDLNGHIERENRKYDGHFLGCRRQAHTPSIYQKGLIAFRDVVLLNTGSRARRLQHAIRHLASLEALDLPDMYWDVMTAFVALLEELDVMDDLTGGGRMRGQSKLRKLFLQPLRMLQCEHSHRTRTGRVRMFGGDRDLIYGPGSEGEEQLPGWT